MPACAMAWTGWCFPPPPRCSTRPMTGRSPRTHRSIRNPPTATRKWMVERALHWAGVTHGLRSARLRYFNAAGADPAGRLGEDHRPESHLVPLVIDAVLGPAPAARGLWRRLSDRGRHVHSGLCACHRSGGGASSGAVPARFRSERHLEPGLRNGSFRFGSDPIGGTNFRPSRAIPNGRAPARRSGGSRRRVGSCARGRLAARIRGTGRHRAHRVRLARGASGRVWRVDGSTARD